jgi:cyclic-di-AMP phosphodiesterase PgpH
MLAPGRTAGLRHRLGRLARRGPVPRADPAHAAATLGAVLVVGLCAIGTVSSFTSAGRFVAGQPSPTDIVAPRTLTFTSPLLTEQRRLAAARAVIPVFTGRDRTVAEDQHARASAVLDHIVLVRANPYAFDAAKAAEIATIPDLAGTAPRQIEALLTIDAEALDRVRAEILKVIALRLRELVRPEDVPVPANSLIGAVDPAMDDATAELVAQVAAGFIVPNTHIDEARTAAAEDAARAGAAPQMVTYVAGQTIVHEGDPLLPEHLEAMERLGLLAVRRSWLEIGGLLAFMTALVTVAAGSLAQLRPGYWRQTRPLALAVLLILLFTFAARLFVPVHVVLGYAFPAAAVAMTLTILLGIETGLCGAVVLAVAVGVVTGPNLEVAVYVLLGGIAGSVVLSHVERLSAFLTAGAAVALTNLAVIAAFRAAEPVADWRGVWELAAAALVNATLATGLTALAALAAGALFGITTSIQLLELARPDHPLLHELQVRAPGTYHHSILIGNLAEAAADAIGADILLVRVAAYYHDVGKSLRPYFYIENQLTGQNPHDGLEPHASARIVVAHVTEGAKLAASHHLPRSVIDAIWQHHGTSRAEFFYHRALEQLGEGQVDETAFRYPGPRPRSREMAILMLADVSEAVVRAASPQSPEEIEAVLERIFRQRLDSGQLDDSDVTLHDLQGIREAFMRVFRRMYHPRVQYPTGIEPAPPPAAQGRG